MRRSLIALAGAVVLTLGLADPSPAQSPYNTLDSHRYYYYPYYYFPHNYWPSMGPQWPEHPRSPYMPPPAYQAYPPFLEPGWRYELWQHQRFYRGHHFWLDQF